VAVFVTGPLSTHALVNFGVCRLGDQSKWRRLWLRRLRAESPCSVPLWAINSG
jgi:hypothetical protein